MTTSQLITCITLPIRKQSEDGEATLCGHIDFAVRYGRHGPLDRPLELIAETSLVARVQFLRQVQGIISVQYRWTAGLIRIPLYGPYDGIGRTIG